MKDYWTVSLYLDVVIQISRIENFDKPKVYTKDGAADLKD